MKPLIILRDEDIFPKDFVHTNNNLPQQERIAVRCIVLDSNNNIALCGTEPHKLLPGGGVEPNETLEESIVRECLEEIGCHVEIKGKVGISEEYRGCVNGHQMTHCFIATVIGDKGAPQSIQEDELNMKVYWYPKDEVISIVKEQINSIPFESYNACFNVRTNYEFLKNFQIKFKMI